MLCSVVAEDEQQSADDQRRLIYNDYCRQACHKEYTDRNRHCKKCYCDKACSLYSDCCLDLPLTDVSDFNDLTAECVAANYPNFPNTYAVLEEDCSPRSSCTDFDNTLVENYEMVTSCPDTETNSLLIDRCKDGHGSKTLPTTDPLTNITYRNTHCLGCNGIQGGIPWSVGFICRGKVPESIGNTWLEVFNQFVNSSLCFKMSRPPEDADVARSCPIPLESVTSKCNVTGRWAPNDEAYEEMIQEGCEKSARLDVRGYKNVFCYYCNAENPTTSEQAVLSNIDMNYVHDIKLWLDPRMENEQQESLDQIWDPFQKRCMNLSCADGKILINGSCQPILLKSNSYLYTFCVDFVYKALSDETNNIEAVGSYSLYTEISLPSFHPFLSKPIAYFMGQCDVELTAKIQKQWLLGTVDPENVDGIIRETLQKLEAYVEKQNTKGLEVKLLKRCTKTQFQDQGLTEPCTIKMDNRQPRSPRPGKHINILLNTMRLTVSKLYLCVQVTLDKSEVQVADDGSVLTIMATNKTLHGLQFEETDGGYKICLDDYIDTVDYSSYLMCAKTERPTSGASKYPVLYNAIVILSFQVISIFEATYRHEV
ncbi:hypothetical protein SNE40_005533 [Patella caerulea]